MTYRDEDTFMLRFKAAALQREQKKPIEKYTQAQGEHARSTQNGQ